MTREQKALLYDDLVREGDRVNRKISTIKSDVFRTPAQEAELAKLNGELQILEKRLEELFNNN